MGTGLAVRVDGVALPEEEARAFWQRFSDWMEEHRGDLAGFAANEGFASVHPGVENGRPVLLVSTTIPQRPYGPASDVAHPSRPAGGSEHRHARRPSDRSKRRKGPK